MEGPLIKLRNQVDYIALFAYEAIGMFVFILGVCFSGGSHYVTVLNIFLAVMFVGKVSGGYFNFGVACGVYVFEGRWKENYKGLLTVLAAELVGGYLGFTFGYLANGTVGMIKPPNWEYSGFTVFLGEFCFTFLLMAGIYHCKHPNLALSHDLVLAVLWCLIPIYFAVGLAGKVSGAALNPTVGFCNVTFTYWISKEGDHTSIAYLPCYFFGPLLAGPVGAIYTKYFAAVCADKGKPSEKQIIDKKGVHNDLNITIYTEEQDKSQRLVSQEDQ